MCDDEKLWEPDAIPAELFHAADGWVNINRAPYDELSGVIYKRSTAIKRVAYSPLTPAPEKPGLWQGSGTATVRWLFSELPGTEEHLLEGATFAFLHDIVLPGATSTGQQAEACIVRVVSVISGEGMLYHRPTDGSPVFARPLRAGDAVLVRCGELVGFANEAADAAPLRLLVLG